MRSCQRNQRPIYYRLHTATIEIEDEYGNKTGSYYPTYADPVAVSMNVSPAKGEAGIELFGQLDNYDKVLVTSDMACPINEETVLYIDTPPVYDETAKEWSKWDYVVTRVARSINSISYAVEKVKVS